MYSKLQFILPLIQELMPAVEKLFLQGCKQWTKQDSSPLTEADLLVHDEVNAFIQTHFPQDLVISEEETLPQEALAQNNCWIIDPIDGTSEFTAGRKEFCIMLAYVEQQVPQFAAIALPMEDKIYFSYKDGPGLELILAGQRKIMPLPTTADYPSKILISRSRCTTAIKQFAQEAGLDLLRCGSAGVKAIRLLEGQARIYAHQGNLNIWDYSPVEILLNCSGAHCSDLNGQVHEYLEADVKSKGLIACCDSESFTKSLAALQQILKKH